jgi:hypothetical protein
MTGPASTDSHLTPPSQLVETTDEAPTCSCVAPLPEPLA